MSINSYNQLFYAKVDNVFSVSGLADFFTKLEPIQFALAKKIEGVFPQRNIRVKEFGTGTDTTRWKAIQKIINDKNWSVALTDFTTKLLPSINELKKSGHFHFTKKKCDLLQELPILPEKKKCDVILATYVFDSIWFPEDAHYEKSGDNWYKAQYHLDVDKSYKRNKIIKELINNPNLQKKLLLEDFKYIKITKRLERVIMKDEENGDLISEYYKHKVKVSVNYPGGLIKIVTESFEKEIATDGIFITGDIAVNNKQGFIPKEAKSDIPFYMDDYHTSGKVAKFKIEDYGLAKVVLEKKEFTVELVTVEDFIDKSAYGIPINIGDHWLMIIKRNS